MVRSVSIGTTRKALISSAYQCKDLRRPSDRGSLPWSTPPRSPSQTSPSSRRKHKLQGARAVCEVMRGSSGAARGDCARPGQRPLTGRPRRYRGLGRGRLTEPIAAARPCRSELVFMPLSRLSRRIRDRPSRVVNCGSRFPDLGFLCCESGLRKMRDVLPRRLSGDADYASMWMSRSVPATACNSARISALRAAPKACSNRRCAAAHPLTAAR